MKRWERNIFYSLNRETVPEYDKGVCRRSIELVKEEGRQIERRKMTDREFFKGQIRWIPARIWLLQLAVLSLCCLTFTQMTDRGEGSLAWVSVSMAGPLFLLTNAEEFSKLFNPGMYELLLTMRNDIKKTAAVKLLMLGSADVILLLTVILTAYSRGGTSLLQVLAYCLVPFNLMSAGCLAIFRRAGNTRERESCLALGGILGVCLTGICLCGADPYAGRYLEIWYVMMGVSLVLLVCEARKMTEMIGGEDGYKN